MSLARILDPVYAGGKIYFLSGRAGPIDDLQVRSCGEDGDEGAGQRWARIFAHWRGEGDTLVYDQLGEIYLYDTASGTSKVVPIEIDADLPEVRPRIESVTDKIGARDDFADGGARGGRSAWGDSLRWRRSTGRRATLRTRREQWSGRRRGLRMGSRLHTSRMSRACTSCTWRRRRANALVGAAAVKKFALANEPAYYFDPEVVAGLEADCVLRQPAEDLCAGYDDAAS